MGNEKENLTLRIYVLRFGLGFWLASCLFKGFGMSAGQFNVQQFILHCLTMLPFSLILGFLMGLWIWNHNKGIDEKVEEDKRPVYSRKKLIIFGAIFIISGIYEMITRNLGPKWEGMVPSGSPQAFIVGVVTFLLGVWLVYFSTTKE